jgi:predicted metal-dependent HD superfamily phosphohydrolase
MAAVTEDTAELIARWLALWQRLGLQGSGAPIGQVLLAAWAEPPRAYHTLEHLCACLALFDGYRDLAEHADEVEFAIWFHDAIYDPRADDNEARSAAWAADVLQEAQARPDSVARVETLILATGHQATPQGTDAALLADIDLAILGADAALFDRYERQVRAEYGHVPLPAFVLGRRRLLRKLLARATLYSLPPLRARFEAAARRNLRRSLRWSRALHYLGDIGVAARQSR